MEGQCAGEATLSRSTHGRVAHRTQSASVGASEMTTMDVVAHGMDASSAGGSGGGGDGGGDLVARARASWVEQCALVERKVQRALAAQQFQAAAIVGSFITDAMVLATEHLGPGKGIVPGYVPQRDVEEKGPEYLAKAYSTMMETHLRRLADAYLNDVLSERVNPREYREQRLASDAVRARQAEIEHVVRILAAQRPDLVAVHAARARYKDGELLLGTQDAIDAMAIDTSNTDVEAAARLQSFRTTLSKRRPEEAAADSGNPMDTSSVTERDCEMVLAASTRTANEALEAIDELLRVLPAPAPAPRPGTTTAAAGASQSDDMTVNDIGAALLAGHMPPPGALTRVELEMTRAMLVGTITEFHKDAMELVDLTRLPAAPRGGDDDIIINNNTALAIPVIGWVEAVKDHPTNAIVRRVETFLLTKGMIVADMPPDPAADAAHTGVGTVARRTQPMQETVEERRRRNANTVMFPVYPVDAATGRTVLWTLRLAYSLHNPPPQHRNDHAFVHINALTRMAEMVLSQPHAPNEPKGISPELRRVVQELPSDMERISPTCVRCDTYLFFKVRKRMTTKQRQQQDQRDRDAERRRRKVAGTQAGPVLAAPKGWITMALAESQLYPLDPLAMANARMMRGDSALVSQVIAPLLNEIVVSPVIMPLIVPHGGKKEAPTEYPMFRALVQVIRELHEATEEVRRMDVRRSCPFAEFEMPSDANARRAILESVATAAGVNAQTQDSANAVSMNHDGGAGRIATALAQVTRVPAFIKHEYPHLRCRWQTNGYNPSIDAAAEMERLADNEAVVAQFKLFERETARCHAAIELYHRVHMAEIDVSMERACAEVARAVAALLGPFMSAWVMNTSAHGNPGSCEGAGAVGCMSHEDRTQLEAVLDTYNSFVRHYAFLVVCALIERLLDYLCVVEEGYYASFMPSSSAAMFDVDLEPSTMAEVVTTTGANLNRQRLVWREAWYMDTQLARHKHASESGMGACACALCTKSMTECIENYVWGAPARDGSGGSEDPRHDRHAALLRLYLTGVVQPNRAKFDAYKHYMHEQRHGARSNAGMRIYDDVLAGMVPGMHVERDMVVPETAGDAMQAVEREEERGDAEPWVPERDAVTVETYIPGARHAAAVGSQRGAHVESMECGSGANDSSTHESHDE